MKKEIRKRTGVKATALSLSLVLVLTIVALGVTVAQDMTPNRVTGYVEWSVNSTPAVGIGVAVTCNMTTETPVTQSTPPSMVGRFDTLNVEGWNTGDAYTITIPGYVIDSGTTSGTLAVDNTNVGTLRISVEAEVYGVVLTDPADQSTFQNVNATYEITVENTGNVQDTFNLSVTNADNAAVAELNTAQVTVTVGGSTIVKLNVTNETVGTYNVSVYAESVNDASANDTVTIMTTVREAPYVDEITVTPSTKELKVDDTQVFTATAKDQNGSEMSGVVITWTSSNTTVGTVSPVESTTGSGATTTFTALAEGTTTVTAENGTVNDTASVTVYEPVVTTIEVTPSTKELKVDDTQVFTATAKDQNGSEMSGVVITWTSSNPAVGTVSPVESTTGSGATTTFTALAEGTTTVTAENGTVNDTAEVTVEKKVVRRGGGGITDADGDGYSDIQEMIAGTDENDPCDPDPKCAACLASKPAATPTPTPTPTVTPTPTIPPVVTTPTPTPTPTEEPGFEAVFAITGLLAVAYLVLRRKK